MKSFFKEFLRDARTEAEAGPQIRLGAFGKHPAWNDHMDDIGLETESLIAAKRLLYTQGIGGQLSSGAWEKLDESARLPAIHHEFIWVREAQVLVGRMWASRDGKGRALYPMVVCAHGFGVSAETAIVRILPQLESVETQCRAAKSQDAVLAIVGAARAHCSGAIASGQQRALDRQGFDLPAGFGETRFAEILREVRLALANFLRDRFRERTEPGACGMRLAALTACTTDDLVFWSRFFAAVLDPGVPVLLLKPVSGAWIDVLAGEPTSQEFFALRAGRAALPILGEGTGTANEYEQRDALRLWDEIFDPERAVLPQERTWLRKIFG